MRLWCWGVSLRDRSRADGIIFLTGTAYFMSLRAKRIRMFKIGCYMQDESHSRSKVSNRIDLLGLTFPLLCCPIVS